MSAGRCSSPGELWDLAEVVYSAVNCGGCSRFNSQTRMLSHNQHAIEGQNDVIKHQRIRAKNEKTILGAFGE